MHDRDWQVLRELMELRTRFTSVLERVMMTPPPALSPLVRLRACRRRLETDTELVVEVELPGPAARRSKSGSSSST